MARRWLSTLLVALVVSESSGLEPKEARNEIRKLLGVGGIRWLVAALDHALHGSYFFNHNHQDGLGAELWRSDLTIGGTYMVKDIQPGAGDGYPSSLCEYYGKIYFAADNGRDGIELWSSDGTEAGTALFLDINPGSASSFVQLMTACDGLLFFGASDGQHGFELWGSDGTLENTKMLKDVTPGSSDSQISSLECKRSTAGETVLFFTVGTADEHEQWLSDGTPEGTRPVNRPIGESPRLKEEV